MPARGTRDLAVAATGDRERFGKYEILRRIAVGGMAEIYLARALGIEGFEKLVVLKRILPQYADNEEFVQMFLDEARVAATLHHSNVVQVYDIGSVDGQYFLSMEFLHGQDGRQLMKACATRATPLPRQNALAIAIGVCAGLHYAHERIVDGRPLDLVHRDVSPQNVFVTYDGGIKLLDFGIARASSRLTETRGGTLKGKIAYMSPEQCGGYPLDRRSDIFAAAIMLWEMTTGRRLFTGSSDFEILRKVKEEDAPPPSSVVADYPPALEHIVMKGLARDRERRYATAEEMQVDLEDFAREAAAGAVAGGAGALLARAVPARARRVAGGGAGGTDGRAGGADDAVGEPGAHRDVALGAGAADDAHRSRGDAARRDARRRHAVRRAAVRGAVARGSVASARLHRGGGGRARGLLDHVVGDPAVAAADDGVRRAVAGRDGDGDEGRAAAAVVARAARAGRAAAAAGAADDPAGGAADAAGAAEAGGGDEGRARGRAGDGDGAQAAAAARDEEAAGEEAAGQLGPGVAAAAMRPTCRIAVVGLVLVLVAACSVARAAPPGRAAEARRHFERGNALYQQGRYDEAVAELQAGYAIDPRPDFLYAIGQAERKRGDCKAAIRYYQQYVDTGQSPQRTVAVLVQIDRCKQELAAGPVTPPPKAPGATAEPSRPSSPPPSWSPPSSSPVPSEPAPPPAVATPEPPAASTPSPAAPAPRTAARDTQPVYKRWWLWTVVGVAAAGAAVGLGVGLTQHPFNSTLPDLVVGNAAVRF